MKDYTLRQIVSFHPNVMSRAGASQLIVPQVVDQPYWASRVADLGIGAAHDGPVPTFETLSVGLKTALAPQTRKRAAAIADKVSSDGAKRAAEMLVAELRGNML